MAYQSTRGQSPHVGFLAAVMAGLAPDGGLYTPLEWPQLSREVLRRAAHAPYAETAAAVLGAFAGDDLSAQACAQIATRAYGAQWAHPAITPLRQIESGGWLLDLAQGPSLAFKDVAMQLIAELYELALAQTGDALSVICATSGDTGGAAVEALKGRSGVQVFVLLPASRVSDVQRRFMTGSGAGNVHAFAVDGDFDAAQAIVKTLLGDVAFVAATRLSPVNSINWARIVAQAVYYVVAACALSAGGPVNFTVPSGNFGDAYAGYAAKRIGAPIGRIMIATNANDGVAQALASGVYRRAEASRATLSPAMDIAVASNFERIVFEAVGRRGDRLKALYDAFAQAGAYELGQEAHAFMKQHYVGAGVDDGATRAAMQEAYAACGEVLCPHTAVGYSVRLRSHHDGGACVLLATAHPAKFPETVEAALGRRPDLPGHAADLYQRPERITPVSGDPTAVKAAIRAVLAV